jgi:two-component system, OmpR family, sensor kinase
MIVRPVRAESDSLINEQQEGVPPADGLGEQRNELVSTRTCAPPRSSFSVRVSNTVGATVISGAALLVLLTAAGWYALGRGLRPLRRIEHTAAAIASGDLSRRVPVVAAPGTEIGHLATSLNVMLGQLEQAFAARAASEARMRAFVSDASHELRTPLFVIKGSAQLYRMGALAERADVDEATGCVRSLPTCG